MVNEFSAISVRRDYIQKTEDIRVAKGYRSHKATVEALIDRAHSRLGNKDVEVVG